MAKRGQSKWTAGEVGQMVDIYLKECEEAAGHDFPTKQGFCVRWHIARSTVEAWESDELYNEHAGHIARIGVECGRFWERKVLEEPKLQQFAMFMLRQPSHGGYKDKPDNSVSVTIAAKGARINWGK